ncbi:transmembrane protein 53-like isoform X1 [Amborella trichopoda]|nr:transmembrane protein 53-like isoform X1 [Amborella trichopoda]|eukprot:XP_020529949.1 transmembrane protein 53-like isoform X1 [Amborella trichopoda]
MKMGDETAEWNRNRCYQALTITKDQAFSERESERERDLMMVERRRVLVVMVGWLGCNQWQLRRYREWYESRGVGEILTFPIALHQFLGWVLGTSSNLSTRLDCIRHALQHRLDTHEHTCIIFHLFCLGSLMYGQIVQGLSEKQRVRIKGCVIDSGPITSLDTKVAARGITGAVFFKGESLSDESIGGMEVPFEAFLEKIMAVFLDVFQLRRKIEAAMENLKQIELKCPLLYLYSSADRVVSKDTVESAIEEEIRKGRIVRHCDFKYTRHLGHFLGRPGLYSAHLESFLAESLSKTANDHGDILFQCHQKRICN